MKELRAGRASPTPLSGDWPVKSTHQIAAIAYDLVVLVSDYTVAKGSDAASSQNDAASAQQSNQQYECEVSTPHAIGALLGELGSYVT